VPTIYTGVIDSSNPKRIFIGTTEGVFKSEDSGASWSRIKAIPATTVRKLAAVSDCKKLYAVTETGLLKSIDYGENWEKLSKPDLPILAISADLSNPEVLFVATEKGVLKSTNSGLSWVPSSKGLVKIECGEADFFELSNIFDHAIPSMGFRIKEMRHVNIKKDVLEKYGYIPGPWLTELKAHLRENEDLDYIVSVQTKDGIKKNRRTNAKR